MIDSKYDVPFNLIKKVIYIQDSNYRYCIDENGYGHAIIDNYKLSFFMNHYGEIQTETICFE